MRRHCLDLELRDARNGIGTGCRVCFPDGDYRMVIRAIRAMLRENDAWARKLAARRRK